MRKEKFIEEITEFPEQNTFNYDNMLIEETDGDNYDVCDANK